MKPWPFVLAATLCQFSAIAQTSVDSSPDSVRRVPRPVTFDSFFQLSLIPGISTNGPRAGSYINQVSINILSGLSAGNRIIEIGASNNNSQGIRGIQVAALTNFVGLKTFSNHSRTEKWALINSGFRVNASGFQAAGLVNYVRNHFNGFQLAGVSNSAADSVKGFQLAGIANTAGRDVDGAQVSGIFNVADANMAGFQISSLFNYTRFRMSGLQLAVVNKSGATKGKYSTPPTKARGWQVGILNISSNMHGVQVGIVNIAGKLRGKQFGIVNIFPRNNEKGTPRGGTPVGLLNFGSKGSYLRASFNEIFNYNIERTTGNCLNCSATFQGELPFHEWYKKFSQNALILGFNPQQNTWGFGYGFQRVMYNKHSMKPNDPMNELWTIRYGVKFMHLNRDRSLDRSFNLLTRANIDFGARKFGKLNMPRGGYLMAGASLNYFLYAGSERGADNYKIRSVRIPVGKLMGYLADFWPGYSVSYQF